MFPSNSNHTTKHNTMNTRRALRDVSNQTSNNNIKSDKNVIHKRQPTIRAKISKPSVSSAGNENSVTNTSQLGSSQHTISSNHTNLHRGVIQPPSYQHSGHVDDIDERDRNDPLCVTEYVHDMYAHFRMKETKSSVRPVYMENQPYINERMRSILVDWLVEVHLKFKLVPETLYLTVNIIDRYLEKREVSRQKLQLVGVTALLIASKYEEIYPPELGDLVYICDRAYDKNEIIEMEEIILKALQYQVTIPSSHAFLVRYLKAAHADRRIVQLACFILDGTLQSYNLLHYLPSQLAAAAVLIARRNVGRNPWSPTLLKYASYCEEDILPIAKAILREKSSAPSELKAVNKKYSSSRYGEVANTPFE